MNMAAVEMLGIEMVGLAVLVLGLFWLRRRFGLTPLYVSLGVFQPVQVMLSASVYVELWPGMAVSPGTLMFAASLLAILLVYIREDATEARKVIYGILGANLTMTLIMFVASLQLRTPGTSNFLAIAPELFSQGARVTAVGTLMFIADVVLLVLLYTGMRRHFPRFPFMRVLVTLVGVLLFDAIGFTTGAFLERPEYQALLLAAVSSKALIALFFSAALIVYLRFVEPAGVASAAPNHPLRDFFYSFTYREKFELQAEQTEEVEARLEKAQAVAHMGFLDWNLDTNDIFWSDEMLRILGLPAGENLQTLASTQAFVHPDDLAMEPGARRRRDRAAQPRPPDAARGRDDAVGARRRRADRGQGRPATAVPRHAGGHHPAQARRRGAPAGVRAHHRCLRRAGHELDLHLRQFQGGADLRPPPAGHDREAHLDRVPGRRRPAVPPVLRTGDGRAEAAAAGGVLRALRPLVREPDLPLARRADHLFPRHHRARAATAGAALQR